MLLFIHKQVISHFQESKLTAFFNCYPPHLATADSAIKYYLSVYILSEANENFRKLYDTVKVCKCECRFSSPTLPPRMVIKATPPRLNRLICNNLKSLGNTMKLFSFIFSCQTLLHCFTLPQCWPITPLYPSTMSFVRKWDKTAHKWGKHRRNFLFCPLFL